MGSGDDLSQIDISQILETDIEDDKSGHNSMEDSRQVQVIVIFTKEVGASGSNSRREQLCLIPINGSDIEIWSKGLSTLIDHYKRHNRTSRNPFPGWVLESDKAIEKNE